MSTTTSAATSAVELKPVASRDHADQPWHAAIPADECYFAIIDTAALGTPAPSLRLVRNMVASRSPAFDDALQCWLPVPAEHIHAAYAVLEPQASAPGGSVKIVACAVARETLDRVRSQGCITAAPAALPAALTDAGCTTSPTSLNLMVGEFEPTAIKSAKRAQRWLIAASVVLVIGLTTFGLSRRAAHDELRTESLVAAARAVETRAALAAGQSRVEPSRSRTVLTAEAARLSSALNGPPLDGQTLDAAGLVADILSRWPRDRGDLFARLQNIQIVGTGISLTIQLPADADPEPILASLRTLPNWQLQPTQRTSLTPAASGKPEARLNLRLVPAPSKQSS